MTTVPKSASIYVPTGFPKGRPRKGEIRPITPGGAYQERRRAREKEKNYEAYMAERAEISRLWKENNPEAHRVIQRGVYQRKKMWDAAGNNFKVAGPFKVLKTA